jgi:hypothetical protein
MTSGLGCDAHLPQVHVRYAIRAYKSPRPEDHGLHSSRSTARSITHGNLGRGLAANVPTRPPAGILRVVFRQYFEEAFNALHNELATQAVKGIQTYEVTSLPAHRMNIFTERESGPIGTFAPNRCRAVYCLGGAGGGGCLNFAASIATFVSAEVSSTSDRPSVHVVMT